MKARRAVLLVDHGSRRAEANAQLEALAELLRSRLPDRLVVAAHLELAPPDIGQGIARCAAAGAEEVVVHPFFLAPGRHSSEDIPRQLEAAAARHPGLSLRLTAPLGLHRGVVEAVLELLDSATGMPGAR